MKLTDKAAQSLSNLRGSPDFRVYLEWLKDHRNQFREECCTHSPDKVQRPQGKVEVVDGILRAYEEAPAVTEKFKSNRRNTP